MCISLALSLIPNFAWKIRNPLYDWAALTCFRILSRSFSGVIHFHNEQYRPKSDGICVANHTTPIDVVVLSCDRSYALVTSNLEGQTLLLFPLDFGLESLFLVVLCKVARYLSVFLNFSRITCFSPSFWEDLRYLYGVNQFGDFSILLHFKRKMVKYYSLGVYLTNCSCPLRSLDNI